MNKNKVNGLAISLSVACVIAMAITEFNTIIVLVSIILMVLILVINRKYINKK